MGNIQNELDVILRNQNRLQLNIRPAYTAVDSYNETVHRRQFVLNYRENINDSNYVN